MEKTSCAKKCVPEAGEFLAVLSAICEMSVHISVGERNKDGQMMLNYSRSVLTWLPINETITISKTHFFGNPDEVRVNDVKVFSFPLSFSFDVHISLVCRCFLY